MAIKAKDYVALTVATLKADGKRKPAEFEAIKRFAKSLNFDVKEIGRLINKELSDPSDISTVINSITEESDRHTALEACIFVAISDNIFAQKEIDLLLPVCKALGFTEETLLSITDKVLKAR